MIEIVSALMNWCNGDIRGSGEAVDGSKGNKREVNAQTQSLTSMSPVEGKS